MADTVTVGIAGLKELGEAMRRLSVAVDTKLSAKATGAGAQVIKALAIQGAPIAKKPYYHGGVLIEPGNIARNIITKKLPKGQTSLTSEHIVTLRHKGPGGVGPSRIGVFEEFGTVKMPAKPFMRPAFDGGKGRAANVIIASLAKGIEDEAGK